MLFSEQKNKYENPEEVRDFIPVSSSFSFKNLKPSLELAENSFMRPLFSDAVYDQIKAYYDNNIVSQHSGSGSASASGLSIGAHTGTNNSIMEQALRFFQAAEINFAFYKGQAKLSIYISNDGFQRVSAVDGRQSAFHYQANSIGASFKEDAYTAIDLAFKLLEKHPNIFTAFTTSDYYTIVKNCLVSNATEFNKIYSISDSRVVFLNLIPQMTKAQDLDLSDKLGTAFIQYVKANLSNTNEYVQEIIRLTKSAVVHLTVARAVSCYGVNFTDKGLFFETLESGNDSTYKQTLLSQNEKGSMAQAARNDADSYIESIIALIKLHPELNISYADNNSVKTPMGSANGGIVMAI